MEANNQKPLILELEEAKASFIQLINVLQQKGLPLYLINMAFDGVYTQLKEGVRAELMAARQMDEQNAPQGE